MMRNRVKRMWLDNPAVTHALTLTLSPLGRGNAITFAERVRSTLLPLPHGERAGVRA
jgi:hypothetical protein